MYKELEFSDDFTVFITKSHAKGYFVSDHWHNHYELLYVMSGSAKQSIESQTMILNKGDFFLIPKNALHSTFSLTDKCEIGVIQFNCTFIQNLSFNSFIYYADNQQHSKKIPPFLKQS